MGRCGQPWIARAIVAAVLLPSSARAQTAQTVQDTRAEAYLRNGEQLQAQGAIEPAVELYEQAYQLGHQPRAAAMLALAEQSLQHWVKAARILRQALAVLGDPWVDSHRAALESVQADIATHVGELWLTHGPPGATVWIDDESLGTLPFLDAVPVRAGLSPVAVRVGDSPPFWLTVQPGEVIHRDLSPVTVTVVPTELVPSQPVTLSYAPPVPTEHGQARGSQQRIWGWLTVGVGVVLGSVGAVEYVMRETHVAAFNTQARCWVDGGSTVRGDTAGGSCTSDLNQGRTEGTLGMVGLVSAGVFLATGIVVLATAPTGDSSPVRAGGLGLRCGPGPGTAGISCTGTF